MARELIQNESNVYLVSLDDPVVTAARLSLLAGVRLVDELTGAPPAGGVAVTPLHPPSTPRVAEGGLVGLVGIPRNVFPKLATTAYAAEFTVAADGYLSRTLSIAIPIDPTFPATFAAPPMADLRLHRVATSIWGRVMSLSGPVLAPAAGASVVIDGVWRTPPASLSVVADPPNLVSLTTPLYADRGLGAQLTVMPLTPVPGDDKATLDDLPAGANPVRLSNRLSLAPGDLVLLDPDDPDRAEYLSVVTVAGATTPAQPASFTFAFPTARTHRKGTVARKVTPGASGLVKSITVEGWSGDSCVFLADVLGLTVSFPVRISSAGIPDEYHTARTLSAVADAQGFFRLPPLGRVAQVSVRAKSGARAGSSKLQPDYARRTNVLDLMIK